MPTLSIYGFGKMRDGIDQDCSGVDMMCSGMDLDGTGWANMNAMIPMAIYWARRAYDGIDNDCDETVDEF